MNRSSSTSSEAWRDCSHRFVSFFGPCLRCQKCGATTMACVAPGESKPIYPPTTYVEEDTNA